MTDPDRPLTRQELEDAARKARASHKLHMPGIVAASDTMNADSRIEAARRQIVLAFKEGEDVALRTRRARYALNQARRILSDADLTDEGRTMLTQTTEPLDAYTVMLPSGIETEKFKDSVARLREYIVEAS